MNYQKSWDPVFRNSYTKDEQDFVSHFAIRHLFCGSQPYILDAGSGPGRNSITFAERGFKVVAFDQSSEALGVMQKSDIYPKIGAVKGDLGSLPYAIKDPESDKRVDEVFDGILCTSVLHHGTKDQRSRWLAELDRVLRKYGIMFLTVLSKNDPRYGSGEEVEENTYVGINDTFDPEVPHHFYTLDEVMHRLPGYKLW